jgi:hypothetical protein
MPQFSALLVLAAVLVSEDRFIHFLGGVPVAEITLQRKGGQYTYVSQRFFRGGAGSIERFTPSGSDNPVWASESLLKAHPVGCWAVEDELTRERGEACVNLISGGKVKGTLLGKAFTARYVDGMLQELELGDSRFARREGPVKFSDPFAEGLDLPGQGTALEISPPIKGTRRAAPKPSGENPDCLAAANAWVEANPGYEVVLGLIDDGERGWPHAWVRHRQTGEEVDPSRPDASALYLALPKDQAGRIYLDLWAKRRTLRRVSSK